MIIKYIAFIAITFVLGCKDSIKKTDIDNILLKKIIEQGSDLPTGLGFTVFVKCEDGYSELTIDELIAEYINMSIKEDYEVFMKRALNHQYVFRDSIQLHCFELDKEILENYYNVDFSVFIVDYFIKNNDLFILKMDVDEDKLKTIFYLCYINNYLISFDDEIGIYYLRPSKFYY